MTRTAPALFLALVLSPAVARAADSEAEALFVQGNTLAAAGRYAEACPKLAESDRLEPAIGTRFNLADCYEHLGRTATAHAMFLDVAKTAHTAGKFERERLAKERAATIVPRLARIRLDVRTSASGVELHLDDAVVPRAQWREERIVDPGAHRITASATGRTPWETTTAVKEGALAVVIVPELGAPAPVAETPPPATAPDGSGRRALALVLGGLGVASVAVGGVTAGMALSSRSEARQVCPENTFAFRCPTQAGADEWSSASTYGNVSTITFIVGGALLATAAVLWATAPSSKKASAQLGAWSF